VPPGRKPTETSLRADCSKAPVRPRAASSSQSPVPLRSAESWATSVLTGGQNRTLRDAGREETDKLVRIGGRPRPVVRLVSGTLQTTTPARTHTAAALLLLVLLLLLCCCSCCCCCSSSFSSSPRRFGPVPAAHPGHTFRSSRWSAGKQTGVTKPGLDVGAVVAHFFTPNGQSGFDLGARAGGGVVLWARPRPLTA
jgi:hypothetical protein